MTKTTDMTTAQRVDLTIDALEHMVSMAEREVTEFRTAVTDGKMLADAIKWDATPVLKAEWTANWVGEVVSIGRAAAAREDYGDLLEVLESAITGARREAMRFAQSGGSRSTSDSYNLVDAAHAAAAAVALPVLENAANRVTDLIEV